MNYGLKMRKQLAIFALAAGIVVSCNKDADVNNNQSKKPETAPVETPAKPVRNGLTVQDSMLAAQEKIQFSTLIFPKGKKDSVMGEFIKNFSEEERYNILALNRLDNKNRWRADTLVIPNDPKAAIMNFAPFPLVVDSLAQVDKLAMFSYNIHAYGLYEKGKLIKWGPSSMGKKATPTKKGLMFTNWKKEVAISTSNSEWILRWNFNIHNTLGIGWHQYELPGFHASHSCLRLLEEDAKYMYSWADQWVLTDGGNTVKAKGTPVIVFADTDFKEKPWLKLAGSASANNYKVEDINSLVSEYIPEILKEQKNSDSIRAERAKLITRDDTKSGTKKQTGSV